MTRNRPPRIEFICQAEDRGVIAEPIPAKAFMPGWFKNLPAVASEDLSVTNNALTVKRCMPFLDALTTGWIIPLAADVRLDVKDGGQTIGAGWDFDRAMISFHNKSQVTGHPHQPRAPCKFHNYWTIRTEPGVSCLFLPPLNRPNPVFEVVAGIVDTDTYVSHINFPFFPTGPDGIHRLERGTPLVQVIPFRRADAACEATIKVETKAARSRREKILRSTQAGEGWYRRAARAPR